MLSEIILLSDRFMLPSSLVRMLDADYWQWNHDTERYISANDIITAHGIRRYAGRPVRAGVDQMLKMPWLAERHNVRCSYTTCNGQYTSTAPHHIYCDNCLPYRTRNLPLPDTSHIDSAVDSFLYGR